MGFKNSSALERANPILGSPRLRVAIVPNHPSGLGNRIFSPDFVLNRNWMEAGTTLLSEATRRNILLSTIDLVEAGTADVIIVTDLPKSPSEITQLRQEHPDSKILLLSYESPAVQPHAFDSKNHGLFDGVVTYQTRIADDRFYFSFRLPVGNPPVDISDPSFSERGLCVLLNSNYYVRILDLPRPWNRLRHYSAMRESGWAISPALIRWHQKGLNYHRRQTFARAGGLLAPGDLDIYGTGWGGLSGGWFRRFFPERAYSCWRGEYDRDKLTLLPNYRFAFAFENFRGNVGYISEKIFDALYGGCVPVYLGDEKIAEQVPANCFVDAGKFRSDFELLSYLKAITESEWKKMREAGQRFIHSQAVSPFQPAAYAHTLLGIVEHVAAQRDER